MANNDATVEDSTEFASLQFPGTDCEKIVQKSIVDTKHDIGAIRMKHATNILESTCKLIGEAIASGKAKVNMPLDSFFLQKYPMSKSDNKEAFRAYVLALFQYKLIDERKKTGLEPLVKSISADNTDVNEFTGERNPMVTFIL